MLAVLLTILKILLHVILAILGLALLIVLIVLFVPVRYRCIAKKYEGIEAFFKVTYLLHLVRAIATYDGEKMLVKVKVLFFTVYTFEKEMSMDKEPPDEGGEDGLDFDVEEMDVDEFIELWNDEKAKEEAGSGTAIDEEVDSSSELHKVEGEKTQGESEKFEDESKELEAEAKETMPKDDQVDKEDLSEEDIEKSIKKEIMRDKKAEKRAKKEAKKRDKARKKEGKEEGKAKKYLAKAKRIYAFLKKDENEGVLRFILGKIYKILKSVLPKKISGDLHFGLKEPDMTGLAVGGFSLFYPYLGKNFALTPDFTRDIIEGTLKFRGRILVVELLYFAIATLADKRVRRLIAQVRTN